MPAAVTTRRHPVVVHFASTTRARSLVTGAEITARRSAPGAARSGRIFYFPGGDIRSTAGGPFFVVGFSRGGTPYKVSAHSRLDLAKARARKSRGDLVVVTIAGEGVSSNPTPLLSGLMSDLAAGRPLRSS